MVASPSARRPPCRPGAPVELQLSSVGLPGACLCIAIVTSTNLSGKRHLQKLKPAILSVNIVGGASTRLAYCLLHSSLQRTLRHTTHVTYPNTQKNTSEILRTQVRRAWHALLLYVPSPEPASRTTQPRDVLTPFPSIS